MSFTLNESGSWLPIASISGLTSTSGRMTFPTRVEVAGEKYVVWNTGDNIGDASQWAVASDACAHRSAPLSQGRVDPITKCIECPYHGWQFNTLGKCSRIPQLDEKFKEQIPAGSDVPSFPTYITGDMLWAFLPMLASETSYPSLPDKVAPLLANVTNFIARDLPYSFDFLIENFLDPAHIPYAHHSLQGVRSDGSPIPTELVTSIENNTHIEIKFKDVVRGKSRDGVLTFIAPCYVTLTSSGRNSLLLLCVPVSPGASRVFVGTFFSSKLLSFFPSFNQHL
jgi:phenylpropionate dioxygenase-like ring-hydroxylating dioxygenase large terminal subunit